LTSKQSNIHPTAIIDPKAQLDSSVAVGAYSIIGANVEIGPNTRVGPHVVLQGPMSIGASNTIYQFASVGEASQDKKYNGEPTRLEIGNNNTIRECATLQRGTVQDRGTTSVGDGNLFMAYTHVGHDSIVKNNCVFANSATIAGHVIIGNGVILGGFSGIHQFCSVGDFAMSAMCSAVNMDIPAFVRVQGNMASVQGMNMEGMKRQGYPKETIQMLQKAYKLVYRENLRLAEAIDQIKVLVDNLESTHPVHLFLTSLQSSKRGITR